MGWAVDRVDSSVKLLQRQGAVGCRTGCGEQLRTTNADAETVELTWVDERVTIDDLVGDVERQGLDLHRLMASADAFTTGLDDGTINVEVTTSDTQALSFRVDDASRLIKTFIEATEGDARELAFHVVRDRVARNVFPRQDAHDVAVDGEHLDDRRALHFTRNELGGFQQSKSHLCFS